MYWKEKNGRFACKIGFTRVDMLLQIAHRITPNNSTVFAVDSEV